MSDWPVLKILSWTTSYLQSYHIDSPRLTAEILLAFCLGINRIDLYLQHDRPLDSRELAVFRSLVKRRVRREPVAYITGRKGFWESEFAVFPGVLVPRPDTELLVEKTLALLRDDTDSGRPKRILEIGAGSGAVIISVARSFPRHRYFANDLSPEALKAVTLNQDAILGGRRIALWKGSWLDAVLKRAFFDVVVANPPYIRSGDIENLAPEITAHEPREALDGGVDGLDHIEKLIGTAADHVVPGGVLLLEMGVDQKTAIEAITAGVADWEEPCFEKDLTGRERVAAIKKKIVTN